ncbi:NADH-quinone oxidoreductase subunit N [Enemella dayhoffiae]|uniref:NADH-quinone oxidoreductase subunit N n=1 Tax=Enemella dayhoffiae TaxID=2016507 RepID=A0A255GUW9_9ACTN|nr:NADH-quinone oxidoreductase subunit NuoN [Enemella dayhoffiae]OYO18383.1 NADH-quinone oxidoreductase subunit N [Enemella dayhoffiae]
MTGYPPPVEYLQIAPLIAVFLGGCLGVGLEAFVPRGKRAVPQVLLTLLVILIALGFTVFSWSRGNELIGALGSLALDGPTRFIWAILLVLTALSVLVFAERRVGGGATGFTPQAASVPGTPSEQAAIQARLEHTEIYPLLLFALTGMMLFPASNDLLTMFVALEIMSLPLYLMCGMARRRRLLSQEAALKYFLLGALSSAFFLYGVALIYGYSGSFILGEISASLASSSTGSPALLLGGMGLLAIGLLFKVSAVPFHSWTPDVYQGAPTPVTGFMAACTKIAAVGALLRVFFVGFGGARWDWQPLMAAVAVLTMATGSLLAITQTDIKRMLAYSSIAHAGFLLTAITGAAQPSGGITGGITSVSAVLFYLATYGVATIAAFALVTTVRNEGGEVTALAGWSGLAKRSPGAAAAMALLLLSFAGIPLTSGFIGKWAVFVTAWRGGFAWLVVVAVLMSLVAAYFYLRLIVLMFFSPAAEDTRVVRSSWLTLGTVVVGCVLTVLLGILPGPLLELAASAREFLR